MDSLIKTYENRFRESWDEPALTDYGSDLTIRYCDVAKRISYLHLLFEQVGIRPGDKVALCDRNSANWAISMLAILTYRAVAVPLLTDYSNSQLVMLCEHCGARFMVGNKKLSQLWPEGKCPMYLLDTEDLLPMTPTIQTDQIEESLFLRHRQLYPGGYKRESVSYAAEDSLDDMMLLSYTSGSTGNPKGVMLSYRSLMENVEIGIHNLELRKGESALAILPLAHMFGLVFDLLFPMAIGAHVYIYGRRMAPQMLLEALQTVRPRSLRAVPILLEKIVQNKVLPALRQPVTRRLLLLPLIRQAIYRKAGRKLREAFGGNICQVVLGGAALSKEAATILHRIGFPCRVGYGMTECGPLIAFTGKGRVPIGSCGRKIGNIEVKILSDDPSTEAGEILVKGPHVMLGYYNNTEATDDVIDADGWMHTGDLGVIDSHGFLYLKGRRKNMFLTSSGQNIYPEEAEEQVVSHTPFDECVVVQRNGRLVALVYASDAVLKARHLTRQQLEPHLEEYCRTANAHLPKYCQLSTFEQRTEEFEKTPKKNIRRFLYK